MLRDISGFLNRGKRLHSTQRSNHHAGSSARSYRKSTRGFGLTSKPGLEFRSVNGLIEYLLKQAVMNRKGGKDEAKAGEQKGGEGTKTSNIEH
jgi:hypothetical protein